MREADNQQEIAAIIKKQTFEDLIKYTEFDIVQLMDNGILILILKSKITKVIKHLIDNSMDIDCKDKNGIHVLEYLIQYSTIKIVEHYLKKISLDKIVVNHDRLIKAAINNQTVIKFLMDHNIKVSLKSCDLLVKEFPNIFICLIDKKENIKLGDKNLIHYIIEKCPINVIEYAIQQKFYLDLIDKKGASPLIYYNIVL